MNAMRDMDQVIREYLDPGVNELPERSYAAVRATLDKVGQRRPVPALHLPARPDVLAGRSPAFKWLLLAALLLVTVVVGAVVGSALLVRLNDEMVPLPLVPSPNPTSASPTPSPATAVGTLTVPGDPLGGSCVNDSSDETVLQFEERYADENDEHVVVVLPDGTVLSGWRSDLTFGQGVQQRRLTEEGLDRLAAMVNSANLQHCQPVAYDKPDEVSGQLTVRTEDGPVVAWFGGVPLRDVRRRSPEENRSIATLFEQLRDLDAALEPSSWRDEAWQQYVPEQWKLNLTPLSVDPGCGAPTPPTTEPTPASCLHWAAFVRLPDGTPLISFGTHYPVVRSNEGGFVRAGYRCGLVDRESAAVLPDVLQLSPSEDNYVTYERILTGAAGSEDVTVSLTGLLPGDLGCEPDDTTEPTEPPPNLAPEIDACELLRDVVPDLPNDNVQVGFLPMRGGGEGRWKGCIAWPEPGDLGLFIRGRSTSELDAASYVTSLFGQGIQTEQVLGRTVFWNDCFTNEADCTPAVAIESDPHLVILSWRRQNRSDFRPMLERVLRAEFIP